MNVNVDLSMCDNNTSFIAIINTDSGEKVVNLTVLEFLGIVGALEKVKRQLDGSANEDSLLDMVDGITILKGNENV